jgi:hypothetical protein
VHTRFWWGSQGEREYLQDLDFNRNITLKWNFKNCDGLGVNWIDLV